MKKDIKRFPKTSWSASSLWAVEFTPLITLILSLSALGVGEGLLMLSNLGSSPWTVLAQGLSLKIKGLT